MTLLLSVSAFVYLALLLFPEMRKSGGGHLLDRPAPELHFDMPGLGPATLSEFKGQAVLLNFWADWCLPCLEEMPSLKLLEQKLDPKRFVLIAINVEGKNAKNTVEAIGAQLPKNTVLSFRDKELDAYGVSTLPYSVLLDSSGIVRKVYIGSRDWAKPSIIEEIQSFLPPASIR